jgi:GMP synthase PP-ATPase subunit
MGDDRTYQYTIVIRAVESADGMDGGLGAAAVRRAGEDLQPHRQRGARQSIAWPTTSAPKPPSTIEWE